MLTFRRTDLIVASELDSNKRIKKDIYYTSEGNKYKPLYDKETNGYTCPFCFKVLHRKDVYQRHDKACIA